MINPRQDEELVQDFLSGDTAALEDLFKRHQKFFSGIIFSIIKNQVDTQDLLQELFIKIQTSLLEEKYDARGKFKAWAALIARNLTIDRTRRKKISKHRLFDMNAYDSMISGTEDMDHYEYENDRNRRDEFLLKCIEKLSPNLSETITLYYFHNLKAKDIAAINDISVNTVLGQLRYARRNIKEMLLESEFKTLRAA